MKRGQPHQVTSRSLRDAFHWLRGPTPKFELRAPNLGTGTGEPGPHPAPDLKARNLRPRPASAPITPSHAGTIKGWSDPSRSHTKIRTPIPPNITCTTLRPFTRDQHQPFEIQNHSLSQNGRSFQCHFEFQVRSNPLTVTSDIHLPVHLSSVTPVSMLGSFIHDVSSVQDRLLQSNPESQLDRIERLMASVNATAKILPASPITSSGPSQKL